MANIKATNATSVNSYLRHIKSGLNWAKQEEYITRVPAIKMYKTANNLTRYLTKEEVKQIKAQAAKLKDHEMSRIITFALFTGCRREEIINARYEHIQNGKIRITGKGSKERIIPLLPQAHHP